MEQTQNNQGYFSEQRHKAALDNGIFFPFTRDLLESDKWRGLPVNAKGVYPVMGVHCNKAGDCRLSLVTIAELAGMSRNTATRGIEGLLMSNFVERTDKTSYHIFAQRQRLDSERFFRFPKTLVTSGIWRIMPASAKVCFLDVAARLTPFYLIDDVEEPGKSILVGYSAAMDILCEDENIADFIYCWRAKCSIAEISKSTGLSRRSVMFAMNALTTGAAKNYHILRQIETDSAGTLYEYRYSFSGKGTSSWIFRPEILSEKNSMRLRREHGWCRN